MVKVHVDSQGRLVIPADIRERMGIGEEDLTLIASHGEMILRKEGVDSDEIEEWRKEMDEHAPKVGKVEEKDSKWFSEDYGKRKLGL